ncbi:MAG: RNA-binding protein, partial [Candidatus Heimdallarchaeota archaeon]|nr:RNA-binding protein [Candidatus Heimdallarchaeota archaeon]
CHFKLGKSYPLPLRPDIMKQLPYLKTKFPNHADYAGKQITDIFTEEQLSKAVVKKAVTFATTVFYGNKEGTFTVQPLPTEVQYSPVYAIMSRDFNSDGIKDLLLAGNFHGTNPQIGRYDANYGILLTPEKGARGYAVMPIRQSGLSLTGQVRDMISLRYRNGQEVIIFTKNDDPIQVYEISKN